MNDGIDYKPSKTFIFNFKIPKEYFIISVIVLNFFIILLLSSGHPEHFFLALGLYVTHYIIRKELLNTKFHLLETHYFLNLCVLTHPLVFHWNWPQQSYSLKSFSSLSWVSPMSGPEASWVLYLSLLLPNPDRGPIRLSWYLMKPNLAALTWVKQ